RRSSGRRRAAAASSCRRRARSERSPPSRARAPRRSSPETRGARSRRPRMPSQPGGGGSGKASAAPSIVTGLLDARSRAADLLALVPAAAVPLLFLHSRYQAHGTVGPADVYSSDVAVAVTVLAAIVAGAWFGWQPLRRPLVLWYIAGALLALCVVACF